MMKKWQALKRGDIIDIIAPGYAVENKVIQSSVKKLKELGFIPRISKKFQNLSRSKSFFHSNTDIERFKQLKSALFASDSSAVWCLRGGYGSNRLLPYLGKMKAPKKAKLFIGISDVTSLHIFLNKKWKWNTMHGTLLDRVGKETLPKRVLNETLQIISGEQNFIEFSNLKPLNKKAENIKSLSGSIIGGNLIVLQTTIGTNAELNLDKKFLFIEEYGERGYRIDRALEHLKQSGCFRSCLGLLVGQLIGGDEPDRSNRCFEAIKRFAQENPHIPVWTGVESGHGERLRPLPFGTKVLLKKIKNRFNLFVDSGCKK